MPPRGRHGVLRVTGAVSAFAIDAATGALAPLGQQASGGADPLVGRVPLRAQRAELDGDGLALRPGPRRARAVPDPHDPAPAFSGENTAAEIQVSPDGRFLYASNRGHDSLALFGIDPASGALAAAGHLPAGGRAPRHFALDPSGRWLLAANQGSNSVTFFRRDPVTGRLAPAGRPLALSKPVCVLFAPPVRQAGPGPA